MGRLDDGLPASLADVWNGSGILASGMAAEVGFHAVDRQIKDNGDFLVPQSILPKFPDCEFFSFCHNVFLSERHKELLALASFIGCTCLHSQTGTDMAAMGAMLPICITIRLKPLSTCRHVWCAFAYWQADPGFSR